MEGGGGGGGGREVASIKTGPYQASSSDSKCQQLGFGWQEFLVFF